MSNSSDYFKAIRRYREGISVIKKTYENDLSAIEDYQGSRVYSEKKAEVEQKKNDSVEKLREEVRPLLDETINAMRETAINRKMGVPSDEEIRLLQVLKMREKVSRDELLQAARTLGNSSVALAVLDEIAAKNNMPSFSANYEPPSMGTERVNRCIDSLSDMAKGILSVDIPRDGTYYSAQRNAALYGSDDPGIVPDMDALKKIQYDFDVDSENDLLCRVTINAHERDIFKLAVNEGK